MGDSQFLMGIPDLVIVRTGRNALLCSKGIKRGMLFFRSLTIFQPNNIILNKKTGRDLREWEEHFEKTAADRN